jgi:hypothetical protein
MEHETQADGDGCEEEQFPQADEEIAELRAEIITDAVQASNHKKRVKSRVHEQELG